jgi:uroporphyrinogen-III synthase
MAKPLTGKRIAVAGGRRFDELQALIGKLGGEALSRPMMASAPMDDPLVTQAIETFTQQGGDWTVLVTGMGTSAMLEAAATRGLEQELLARLQQSRIAARGYKTVKTLKSLGLTPVVQDDDGTLEGLTRQLEPYDLQGKHVAIQFHGEVTPELIHWFESKGATVHGILLYRYVPPTPEFVESFLRELERGEIDAVAFTSNTQVRFLFEATDRLERKDWLRDQFNHHVVVGSVGSMTSRALREHGVHRFLVPEHERMGAMIMALADHFASSVKTST